jgi:hypothetical protein
LPDVVRKPEVLDKSEVSAKTEVLGNAVRHVRYVSRLET